MHSILYLLQYSHYSIVKSRLEFYLSRPFIQGFVKLFAKLSEIVMPVNFINARHDYKLNTHHFWKTHRKVFLSNHAVDVRARVFGSCCFTVLSHFKEMSLGGSGTCYLSKNRSMQLTIFLVSSHAWKLAKCAALSGLSVSDCNDGLL